MITSCFSFFVFFLFWFLIKTQISTVAEPADGCCQMCYDQKAVKSPVCALSPTHVRHFLSCFAVSLWEQLIAQRRNDPGFKTKTKKNKELHDQAKVEAERGKILLVSVSIDSSKCLLASVQV